MSPRKILVVVLGYVLSAAVIVFAPAAQASDNRPDRAPCGPASGSPEFRINVTPSDEYRLSVVFAVFSNDEDLWEWRLLHNDDLSARGESRARDADRSFRVVRRVIDLSGTDDIVFRAENMRTGEVCRGEDFY